MDTRNPIDIRAEAEARAGKVAVVPGRTWAFLKEEFRGLLGSFFKPFFKFTLLSLMLLLLVLVPRVFMADETAGPRRGAEPPLTLKLLMIAGVAISYALHIGLVAGFLSVLWRLVGPWIVLPIILIPAAVILSLWLFSGWLAGQGKNTADGFVQSVEKHKFPTAQNAAGAILKAAHGSGAGGLAVVGLLLLPFLAVDAVPVLTDPIFIVPFTKFLGAVALVTLLGLAPSCLVSLLVLMLAVINRMRARYQEFLKGFKDVVRTTS